MQSNLLIYKVLNSSTATQLLFIVQCESSYGNELEGRLKETIFAKFNAYFPSEWIIPIAIKYH